MTIAKGERLDLCVLGNPAVHLNGRPLTQNLALKEQALLYYLAVTRQSHSRHTLAGLFWGNTSEQKAKTSLRVALSGLRKQIPAHLTITHLSVTLDPESDFRLDAADLEHANNHLNDRETDPPLKHLQTIAALYHGDFLRDFFVEGTPAFEEWLLSRRSYYRQIALRALVLLARRLMNSRSYAQALDVLAQWLAIEPWDEEAHRQMMLAHSRLGSFNAALAQYEQCRRLLQTELDVEPMPETTALYERIQLARQSPALPLPPDETPLVGRQAEMTRLHQMLTTPGCRLVTITGLGGVGKTRLALAAAHLANREQAVDYLNGVVFIPLAGLASAETLPLALADALELYLSGQTDPLSDVLNFLAEREMLLIFDNFEQLLDGVNILNQILQHCPAVKLLVTSREPLRLTAEWRLTLEGLTYPPENTTGLAPETIQSYEAIQLFIQAAQQVRPNFRLTPDNIPLLQRLCCLVDGMPLALRLSATWLRAISLSAIIDEIENGLDILETTLRDVPERQRSMRVIFTQAWSLLNDAEKRVFPALSVFRGGFDTEAVAAVAGARPPLLAGLVDRGLLQLTAPNGRYALHELTRQFAAEKLAAAEEEIAIGQQHSEYYLKLVAHYDPVILGAMRQSAISTLRHDIDNIRQAWRWALQAEKFDWLHQSIDALAAYFEITGLFDEAIQLFGRAAEKLAHSAAAAEPPLQITIYSLLVKEMEFSQMRGDYDKARTVAARIFEKASHPNLARFQADAHRELGILERWSGRLSAAEAHLRQAAIIYEEINAEWPLAATLDWLGLLVSDYGKIEEALAHLERAARLHAKVNNQRGQVFNKGQTAVVLVIAGRLLESLVYQLEVLDEYIKIGYPLYIARTANNIGLISIELGEYEAGIPYMERALQLQRQTGALLDSYNTLGNKGELHLNLGEYHEARRCFDEAQRFFEKTGATLLEGENLWRLGKLYLDWGEYGPVQRLLERCLMLSPKSKDVETFAFAGGLLAQFYWRQGDISQAINYFDEAAVPYNQVRRPLELAEFVHLPRAFLLLEQGEITTAVHSAQEAAPWLQNAGRHPALFISRLLQAKITAAQGNQAEAGQQLEQLLKGPLRPSEQAAAHYELWHMTRKAEHGRRAIELYQELTTKTPKLIYRQRLQELNDRSELS